MAPLKNLVGQRFGRLVVLERADKGSNGVFWLCRCDCGNLSTVRGYLLTRGKTKSCGCLSQENRRRQRSHLEGMRFGRLLVLNRISVKSGGYKWQCVCDCGRYTEVVGTSLLNGDTRSCGCLAREVQAQTGMKSKGRKSPKMIDLTGQRFGLLTVIERAENAKNGVIRWRCKCDCGKETITSTSHLRSGHTKSCGCLGLRHATEAKIKHGMSGTHLYNIFRMMHGRCEDPKNKAFPYYGGRGIKVCDEWTDFEIFKVWALSNDYEDGLSIDRIDPNGNYEPSNCEWVTRSENSKRMHAYYRKLKQK